MGGGKEKDVERCDESKREHSIVEIERALEVAVKSRTMSRDHQAPSRVI